MKRIVLSLFVLLILSFAVTAQVDINPGTISLEAQSANEIHVDIYVTNNSDEDMEIFWTYEPASSYPSNWKTQICDTKLCYNWDNFSSSGNLPNEVAAGEEAYFYLKVKNNVNELLPISGSSYGILKLYDDRDKTNLVAETAPLSVSTKELSYDNLVIYPNPTTESFQLSNDSEVATISLFNIVGRLESKLNHTSGMRHDVSNLRSGMYLVRLENSDGDVIKSMRLSKK